MANRAIAYVDLLGVQKVWVSGGWQKVKNRIEEFNDFVLDQLRFLPADLHRNGEYVAILSGDSLSIVCQDFVQAVGIARHFFVQAFYATAKMDSPFWLRGAIARWNNQYLPVNTRPIQVHKFQVGTQYVSEDDYLAALALEKSGFKGMRLIINQNLLENRGRGFTANWDGFYTPLGTVVQLLECQYPMGSGFADVLWMVETESRYKQLKNIMASRFKKSTHDPDEFVQASWTRAVFDQVDSLVWSCRKSKGHVGGADADSAVRVVHEEASDETSTPEGHDAQPSR